MNTMTGATLEHEIGSDGLLAVRLRDGDVRLRGFDGDTVRVRDVNGNDLAEMFTIESATGSLSLKTGRGLEIVVGSRSMRRGHGRHTPDLEIDIPRQAAVVLEATSGDVTADDLLGDQRYRTVSGDVALRSVSGRLSIEAVSGDIDVTAIGDAAVDARSESGDIQLRAARLSALRLTSTSGDLKVAGQLVGPGPFTIETVSGDGLLAPAGDVRIEMTSVTGDLSSDLEGSRQAGRGRQTFQVGASGPLVTFRSTSGDLHVGRPTPVGRTAAPSTTGPAGSVASATPEPPPRPIEPTIANGAIAAAYDDARLRILRSLERGEIDVAEAGRRLETLDAGDVTPDSGDPVTDPAEERRADG